MIAYFPQYLNSLFISLELKQKSSSSIPLFIILVFLLSSRSVLLAWASCERIYVEDREYYLAALLSRSPDLVI